MNEVVWNGGLYRVGGTLIYNGGIKVIKSIDTTVNQKGPSIFDRNQVLIIITEDGTTIQRAD